MNERATHSVSSGPVDFEDVEIATAAPFAGADDGRFAKYVAHGLRILGNREAGRNRDDTHAAHHRGADRDGRIE